MRFVTGDIPLQDVVVGSIRAGLDFRAAFVAGIVCAANHVRERLRLEVERGVRLGLQAIPRGLPRFFAGFDLGFHEFQIGVSLQDAG